MIHHDGSTRRIHTQASRHKAADSRGASTTLLAGPWSDFGNHPIYSSRRRLCRLLEEQAAMRKCMALRRARNMVQAQQQPHNHCSMPQICKVRKYRDKAIVSSISNMAPMSCTVWGSPRNRRHSRLMIPLPDTPSDLGPCPRHRRPSLGRHKRQHSITLQDSRFRVRQCPNWPRLTYLRNIRRPHTREPDLQHHTQAR